jgi:hypothetical protein
MIVLAGGALFSTIVLFFAYRRLADAGVSQMWLLPTAASLFLSVNFWFGLSIISHAPPGIIRLSVPIGLVWLLLLLGFMALLRRRPIPPGEEKRRLWSVAWWTSVPLSMRALLNGFLLASPVVAADPAQAASLLSLMRVFAAAEIVGAMVFLVCVVAIWFSTRRTVEAV